jgi:hypothetical protein
MHSYCTKENFKKISIFVTSYAVVYLAITLVSSVLPSFNAPAPSCITVLNQTSKSMVIRNGCESEQSVKIRVFFALGVGGNTGGNSCITLPPGAIYWTRWWLGKFVGGVQGFFATTRASSVLLYANLSNLLGH